MRIDQENFVPAVFESRWSTLPLSLTLCEIYGDGDPSMGGNADDRPVLESGLVREGPPWIEQKVAAFKTVAEAHAVAIKIPNRRRNSILSVVPSWNH
jgi:acyl-coenzyme A synthetase/AMP-(fatty) acid ligase